MFSKNFGWHVEKFCVRDLADFSTHSQKGYPLLLYSLDVYLQSFSRYTQTVILKICPQNIFFDVSTQLFSRCVHAVILHCPHGYSSDVPTYLFSKYAHPLFSSFTHTVILQMCPNNNSPDATTL